MKRPTAPRSPQRRTAPVPVSSPAASGRPTRSEHAARSEPKSRVRLGPLGARQGEQTIHRVYMLAALFGAIFLTIGGRLVTLATPGADHTATASPVVQAKMQPRMEIVDRRGRLLASDIKAASLYADPAEVIDVDDTADRLSVLFPDLDRDVLRDRLTRKKRFAWIKRELTPRQQAAVHHLGLPGLHFAQERRRVYPAGPMASHVLGHVNVDNRGIAGMERYLDDHAGVRDRLVADEDGRSQLRLSLDLGVQHVLRDELTAAMSYYKAKAAAGVILDVETGEVVALSSLPDYDPYRRKQALEKKRVNRIAAGLYEMGSIFKVFTTAAALDAGVTTIKGGYDATQPLRIASFTINDYHAKKRYLTVPEIFIYSSNIGAAKMALDLGVKRHKARLRSLGLLQRLRTELPEAATPIVPKTWRRINTMTISFGHGLSVTPLQVAAATAALVNGGYLVQPTFLHRQGEGAPRFRRRVLKARTSTLMRKLMRLNVQRGTATKANAEGYRVGGKTGTAEKVKNGRYDRSSLLTSFLGTFPADAPRYVVLVMLDEPKGRKETHGYATAGWNAAPVTAKLVERIAPMLGVAPRLDDAGTFDERILASY